VPSMTDRELLELSLKAAGIPHFGWNVLEEGFQIGVEEAWNSFFNGAQALRLAVILFLEVDICVSGVAVRTPSGHKILIEWDEQPDRYIAVCRAITLAAAEIGRGMG
jgi:hypothetical protein